MYVHMYMYVLSRMNIQILNDQHPHNSYVARWLQDSYGTIKGSVVSTQSQSACDSQAYHSNSLFGVSSPTCVLKLGSKYHSTYDIK